MKVNTLLICVIIAMVLIPTTIASAEYNRERSEELFPLIDWKPYSPETFELALKEQKPIMLVISAPAWCYWCHVYESEDYLFHPDLYPYINEHFISIFVDSDKRPDLTKKYLEGGWPSTTVLTPDLRRLQGFSGPRDPHGLLDFYKSVNDWMQGKHFSEIASTITYEPKDPKIPTQNSLTQIEEFYVNAIRSMYDPLYGGFGLGDAPEWREGQKFPRGLTLRYLLERFEETGEQDLYQMVAFTFENQFTAINELEKRYHLYDPVEGGFHRYGTKRDWSIPHYEKMLADQAKFLLALQKLSEVSENNDVDIALQGTIDYISEKIYDQEGGFYSSQDAHLEHDYYGKDQETRASLPPPFIDKTRRINDNALMISAMLDSYQATGDEKFKEMAKNSLEFLEEHMVTEEGSLFYYDPETESAHLQGQSIANAWTMMAFIEGYQVLDNPKYLETAERLAEFAFDNLYDWNQGAFFTRNSKDIDRYAPNERIDLSKPYPENAVYAYALTLLYEETENLLYLDAAIKTTGYLFEQTNGLDETYFTIKAARKIKELDLLTMYHEKFESITPLIEEEKKTFFVDDFVHGEEGLVPLDDAPSLPSEFANVGFIILVIVAFVAGFLSFISPCTLPVLTAYFAQNIKTKKGDMVKNTFLFFLGLAMMFSLFGMGATFLGSLLRDHRSLLTMIAGSIIIVLGVLEILGKGFSGFTIKKQSGGKLGAFLFGLVFAVGWSACIGPILASLLLLSATTGTIVKGTLLLFVYAMGLGIPLFIISFWFDHIKNKKFWKILQGKIIKKQFLGRTYYLHTTYFISGILLIIIGALIFSDVLFAFNQYALSLNYIQDWLLASEEWIKQLVVSKS